MKITSLIRPVTGSVQTRKQDLGSPEYFATIRRRTVISLLPLVEGLSEFEASENLVLATHPITTELRNALKTLEDSQTEGNSRAIIRQLRDCLLNGGWDHMRDAAKRSTVVKVLRLLTKDGEITPVDVDGSFDMLMNSGLTPVALPAFEGNPPKPISCNYRGEPTNTWNAGEIADAIGIGSWDVLGMTYYLSRSWQCADCGAEVREWNDMPKFRRHGCDVSMGRNIDIVFCDGTTWGGIVEACDSEVRS